MTLASLLSDHTHRDNLPVYQAQVLRLLNVATSTPGFDPYILQLLTELCPESPPPPKIGTVLDSRLRELNAEIHTSRQIKKMPVEVFLSCTRPPGDCSNTLFEYQALLVAASSALKPQYESIQTVDRIDNALRQIRLIVQGRHGASPHRSARALPTAARPLEEILPFWQSTWPNDLNSRLPPLICLIQDLINRNAKRRDHRPRTGFKNYRYRERPPQQISHSRDEGEQVESSYSITEYRNRNINPELAGYVNSSECSADSQPSAHIVRLASNRSSPQVSPQAQRIRTNSAVQHMIRREQRLYSNWGTLTQHELKTVFNYCLAQLSGAEPLIPFTCLLILASGRTVEQIANISPGGSPITDSHLSYDDNNPLEWTIHLKLPKHKLSSALKSLVEPSKDSITLRLPEQLLPYAHLVTLLPLMQEGLPRQVQTFLQKINQEQNTRLSASRLSGCLEFFLSRYCIDPAQIELLTQPPPYNHSGVFYSRTTLTQLASVYQSYIAALFKEANTTLISPSEPIGSRLHAKESTVSKLFHNLKGALDSNRGASKEAFEHFHNFYSLYTLLLLNLATGHRPVVDPYESTRFINEHNQTIYIDDKRVRKATAGRVLVLGATALEQYRCYLGHLHEVRLEFGVLYPALDEHIQGILEGRFPLIFFLNEMKPSRCQPKSLSKQLTRVFPLPPNWNRHFVRSYLIKQGVPPEWIDAWMGHASLSNESFSRHSGLGLWHLGQVAEKIDQMLSNLGIHRYPGRGRSV